MRETLPRADAPEPARMEDAKLFSPIADKTDTLVELDGPLDKSFATVKDPGASAVRMFGDEVVGSYETPGQH